MQSTPDYALYTRIYEVVEQIPRGAVSTYGDVATIVGGGCDGRTAGFAMNELPKERMATVPWQRVINREGGISTRGLLQRQMLEDEGIVFDERDRAILARFRWSGPSAEWAEEHGFNTLPSREEGEQLSIFL